jgi:uncharacterized LabA/DUF88 family protein
MPVHPYLRFNAYVDGAYVRRHLRDVGVSDEFDPSKAAGFIRNYSLLGRSFGLVRTYYYDAIDDEADDTESQRLDSYLGRLQALNDTHVVTGSVRRGRGSKRREQKGVDVRLAVDALEAALSGSVDGVALVSGDADFVPLVDAIRRAGPHVVVLAFEQGLSRDLRHAADRVHILMPEPTDWTVPPA